MAGFAPAHPGDVLRADFLKPLGVSQYALAEAMAFRKLVHPAIFHRLDCGNR